MRRGVLLGLATAALSLAPAADAAAQAPLEGREFERAERRDFGGVRNVLPGGQGETVSADEFTEAQATDEPPPTFVNQLPLYTGSYFEVAGDLERRHLRRFFKDAGFGVAPRDVASVTRPRPGVTIVRDRPYHVPHVYGATRSDTMFGAGYASATDRLFFMDVLRHLGRARLTELVGPGEDNAMLEMDANHLQVAPYTEADLQTMIDSTARRFGAEGEQARRDLLDYTAGVNAYIAEARVDESKLPAEYAALGQELEDWRPTDTVAVASLIGAIFGRGGGFEAETVQALQIARDRFGPLDGYQVFSDFRRENDPEAPVTVDRPFPFDEPSKLDDRGVALLDRGSVRPAPPISELPSAGESPAGPRSTAAGRLQRALEGLRIPGRQSNALLVGRERSASGRPLAVFGPQVAYFSPQVLLELDLHGPGIDARGAAFPGISLYVLLGRGRDFAFSATSAGTDNVDEFVEKLCEPDGSRPTLESRHYLYKGRCWPFEEVTREFTATPSATDPGQTEHYTLRVLRSVHGPVQAFATVAGEPVAVAEARSTYRHELDSAIAFQRLNENDVRDARSFQRAMSRVNFVFNWFYADNRDISFFSSGAIPVRARGTDSTLPAWGTGEFDWRGFEPESYTFDRMPFADHVRATNPDRGYLVNWNNKPAPGFRAADGNFTFGSVHRVERLGDRLRAALRGGRDVDLARVTQVMQEAATVDLRGQELVPLLLEVLGEPSDRSLRAAIAILREWHDTGSHRRDLDGDNVYDHSAAVALMDAWWFPLLEGMFQPVLGEDLYDAIRELNEFDAPGPQGSAFQSGFFSYVDKDLRSIIGRRVRQPFSREYCGRGSRRRCQILLRRTLGDAVAAVRDEHGSLRRARVPATCEETTPPSCDQIVFTPTGAVSTPPIRWQDRPTFQQIVEFERHRPRR